MDGIAFCVERARGETVLLKLVCRWLSTSRTHKSNLSICSCPIPPMLYITNASLFRVFSSRFLSLSLDFSCAAVERHTPLCASRTFIMILKVTVVKKENQNMLSKRSRSTALVTALAQLGRVGVLLVLSCVGASTFSSEV